eukprot:6480659-Amphidinium_carterae.2
MQKVKTEQSKNTTIRAFVVEHAGEQAMSNCSLSLLGTLAEFPVPEVHVKQTHSTHNAVEQWKRAYMLASQVLKGRNCLLRHTQDTCKGSKFSLIYKLTYTRRTPTTSKQGRHESSPLCTRLSRPGLCEERPYNSGVQ